MLDEYFQGTLPQLVERARFLKGRIPRGLPRDYDGLTRTCEHWLEALIDQFRALQSMPPSTSVAVEQVRLRQFRRAVADLNHIETRAIAALQHAHNNDDDHHANRLLFAICQEIRFPILTPTVSTLSSGYFSIDPKLNLMFIPPAEGNFILHLPDLYHELGHPLLTHRNHPVLDRLRKRFLICTEAVHDHFAGQRATDGTRRSPRGFRADLDIWEVYWITYWLTEFFCDLFATYTVGPAYAWSHLHLCMKQGGDAYELPGTMRLATHPADASRMDLVLRALRLGGFHSEASQISLRWQEALRHGQTEPGANYPHCYPDALLELVCARACEGFSDIGCRQARLDTGDPIHSVLNRSWARFWQDPSGYHAWEKGEVGRLLDLCRAPAAPSSTRSARS
jgi:hypothetical protein